MIQSWKAVRQIVGAALIGCTLLLAGCQTTQYYQRRRLADSCMQFDSNGRLAYIRYKIEAAREGSLGGFGTASAGGCGCQ